MVKNINVDSSIWIDIVGASLSKNCLLIFQSIFMSFFHHTSKKGSHCLFYSIFIYHLVRGSLLFVINYLITCVVCVVNVNAWTIISAMWKIDNEDINSCLSSSSPTTFRTWLIACGKDDFNFLFVDSEIGWWWFFSNLTSFCIPLWLYTDRHNENH